MLFILAILAAIVSFAMWQIMKRRVRAGWSTCRTVAGISAALMVCSNAICSGWSDRVASSSNPLHCAGSAFPED